MDDQTCAQIIVERDAAMSSLAEALLVIEPFAKFCRCIEWHEHTRRAAAFLAKNQPDEREGGK